PDDETLVAGYLAHAIHDQGKRVGVVFCTRGDAGDNAAGPERARALGAVREIEGRRALARLGVDQVWFLDGRDTASQSVLRSLGSWPHGAVLEALVRIVRMTRPEVVLTWLPGSVAGENHGDHQAAGVVATEAFDLAGSAVAFPAQLAAPERNFENALDGLHPWQPKKLYFYSDAYDASFLRGPSYALKPYLRQVIEELAPYYSQSPDPRMNAAIEAGVKLDDIAKQATGGDEPFLPDPIRFGLARSLVPAKPTGDVFEARGAGARALSPPRPVV